MVRKSINNENNYNNNLFRNKVLKLVSVFLIFLLLVNLFFLGFGFISTLEFWFYFFLLFVFSKIFLHYFGK